ncbi:MAG: transporter, partial [Ilumatobacteraceae bacterium]|nr:transporter [Ilumatobacteraceae bacterium]
AEPAGLVLVRTDDGARTPRTGPVTIGRASDRTITIDDTRVSRAHATVEQTPSGWAITDAGSSNGTTVNGQALTARAAWVLAEGDVIGIGPVQLRVQREGGGRSAGGRALDDSDRTRISGEVLPPPRRPRP